MPSITDLLEREHRSIEERLDALEAAIRSEQQIAERMAAVEEAMRQHTRREAGFWECLRGHSPALAAKLESQHEQARETFACFAGASEDDQLRLARRYQALVEHNLIEEERDVFPLADRCFSCEEQDELLHF